jgi:hypothetical protein
VILVAVSAARADAVDADIPELPAIGRPEGFDEDEGPIGSFETPTVQAEPRTLQVEDPLTLTVRITAGPGRVWRPPSRPKLDDFPGFKNQFFIEPQGDPKGRRVDDHTWEFTYTLKPKGTDVKAVPSFPFVFFTPGFIPPEKGYQVKRTPSIELTIRPRAAVQQGDVKTDQPPASAPDAIYQIIEGPQVLRRESTMSPQALLSLAAVYLIAVPAGCVVWCLVWRRLNPDAARRATQRRSQAARQALQALRATRPAQENPAEWTASIVADYLRQRLDLPAAEPTPIEIAVHLEHVGCAPALIQRAADFFHACDAARFGPALTTRSEALSSSAKELVLALESETGAATGLDSVRSDPLRGWKRTSRVRCVLLALLLAGPAHAEWLPDDALLEMAESRFREGVQLHDSPQQARPSFLAAASHYSELRTRGVDNVALDRNEGNAYLLGGDLPMAILAYRRGLRRAPDDRGLLAGLAYARNQVTFPAGNSLGQPPREHRPPWLPRLASEWYLVLALLPYTVGCLAVARWWMTRRGRLLGIGLTAFVAAGLLLAGLAAEEIRAWQLKRSPVVVIAANGVPLREGNGQAYPPRYEATLNRGVEARLLFVRGNWLQIELAGGEIGWVRRSQVVADDATQADDW